MSGGVIYSYKDNFRTNKALIAAKYSGAKVTLASEAPDFVIGETNKSEEFLKKFPLGKVPAFQGTDGTLLFKSNAIAYYLATDELRGKTVSDRAQVQQWLDFSDNDILPAYCSWLFPILGIMQYNKQTGDKAKDDIRLALKVLNTHLTTRTFLVGERISLADITVVCHLAALYQKVLDPEFRKPFPHVTRWFTTLVDQPQFKDILGTVTLCTKQAHPDNKGHHGGHHAPHHDHHGGHHKGHGQHGKHGHQGGHQKHPAPKKEAPKPKKPEPADEEEDLVPKEKPSADPFAALPKGTFVMDDWKKCYSNEKSEVSYKYFLEKFDKENYSVWHCVYKYPEDLKLTFMSSNLIGGMMQRLDRMRKYAFGNMILFGTDNNSTIEGVWIWRGHQLAFELSEDLQVDYETYEWKKLDFDKEDTKKMIKEFFAEEGEFGGKKFCLAKTYK